MRQLSTLLFLIAISINALGQHEIKFKVEELSKPDKLINKLEYNDIYKRLILSDLSMNTHCVERENIEIPYCIIAKSEAPDSLVYKGYHAFFNGMYNAYADHRPFVISPDMIWLLISQGFAIHLNENAELLRKDFVDFEDKVSLIVRNDTLKLDSPASAWESIFPDFTKQISEHTGDELISILTSDFSTTSPIEKIASELTIMKAMEPYFEFVVIRMICGIPEITLQGTTEDWEKIYKKTNAIAKYNLKWWTDELEPILKEIIKTSEGEIDKTFWRNMFKYHSQEAYGAPKIIDGWIVKFFPYDKDGKRNNLKELKGGDNLPEEIVKVDLKYIESNSDTTITIPLELWAGFIGLEQNSDDFTLTPKIAWMIRKKDVEKKGAKQKLKIDNKYGLGLGGINIRVKEIPQEIYDLDSISVIEITFIDNIKIENKFGNLKIGRLDLNGKITKKEIKRVAKLLPDTDLYINRKAANKKKRKKQLEGIKELNIQQ